MNRVKKIIRVVKNLKELDKAFQKETSRGSFIKEINFSQSPLDQPRFVAVRRNLEIHYMVGSPITKNPDKNYSRGRR